MLTGLAILGDTSLELTSTGVDDEDSAVGLGGTRDHVLDEVTVAGGINDSDLILGGLELPEGNINGDTTLPLGLELVKHPGVLEGALAHIGGFLGSSLAVCSNTEGTRMGVYLLELLNSTLVDTTALVDQVASRGRLARVDVADDHDVEVRTLFLTVDQVRTLSIAIDLMQRKTYPMVAV